MEELAEGIIPLDYHLIVGLPPHQGQDQRVLHADGKIQVQSTHHCRGNQEGKLTRLQVPTLFPVHEDSVLQYCHPLKLYTTVILS